MGKKSKKQRRALDKLYRRGRYWEWLEKVEALGLSGQFAEEKRVAWDYVIKKALRTPQGFSLFMRSFPRLQPPEQSPEYRLLTLIHQAPTRTKWEQEIMETEGLSPLGQTFLETLRQRKVTHFPMARLRTGIKKFVDKPEKVTRGDYFDLARRIADPSMANALTQLGHQIHRLRAQNSKRAVKQGWSKVHLDHLAEMDYYLEHYSDLFPPSCQRVFYAPFFVQIHQLLQRLVTTDRPDLFTELVAVLGYSFPVVAGDHEHEFRLWLGGEGTDDLETLVDRTLEREETSFEEKLLLLHRLRRRLHERHNAIDSHLESLFLGPMREDLLEGLDDPTIESSLVRTYEAVLDEMIVRCRNTNERESRQVQRIMEPELCEDIERVSMCLDSDRPISRLLDKAFRAGAAGKRLALLCLLLPQSARQGSLLAKTAQQVIEHSEPVDQEDIRWLIEEYEHLYVPEVNSLRILIERRIVPGELLHTLVWHVLDDVDKQFSLYTNICEPGFRDHPFSLPELPLKIVEVLQSAVRSVEHLPEMEPIVTYLKCFPDGRLSSRGMQRWYRYLLEKDQFGTYVHQNLLPQLDAMKTADEASRSLDPTIPLRIENLLRFMGEDPRAIDTIPWEVLILMIEKLTQYFDGKRDVSFLVKIHNVLQEKKSAGEQYAGKASAALLKLMKAAKTPQRRKRGSRSRGRRQ
ncbi:hypothetical protein SAMN02746041_03079 [Desulfacinum hydrothermale DSM 13146]|uniref:Uncharacterized protein n=1 Tax=Desulfacinum hydrothermale DSM 13146 TaxID=1121390 RepID=A0A1W1XVD4_9BACT|nr:hypothetical protein [Desulfacinum hydrothermale]SMC27804.1 hypothetical protein SAMN02746041_03079 [Desulfacinum hydrothermale DSM 13146]